MNPVALSQWQFAITTVYHFFFVPLTIGLSILVAVMQTFYFFTKQEKYKRMTLFWGKLFIINFAMGVVTGLVQEFQFGMNWSNYSKFVGDIFGAPLAIEALLAFFIESTFIGVWFFGWDRIPKWAHLGSIWLVAFGVNISALWILIANSFMQHPVGFVIEGGRAVMTNIFQLMTNPYIFGQFPHTFFAGMVTAGFFLIGISAYQLKRKPEQEEFHLSMKFGSVAAFVAIIGVGLVGHVQMQQLAVYQPMKLAASEALVETENPAGLSVFSIVDESGPEVVEKYSLRIPKVLSFLTFNRVNAEVKGINDLQKEMEAQYGPGDYSPNILITYWSFRWMVGLAFLLLIVAAFTVWMSMIRNKAPHRLILLFLPIMILVPYLANTTGWLVAEVGRQPWVVYGYMKTVDGVSPTVSPNLVLASLIIFTILYGVLMFADVYLLQKYARLGIPEDGSEISTDSY